MSSSHTKLLQVDNLRKEFRQPETIQILDDVNFSLEKGEICSIIGKSGSGKSTFLSLVSGLDRATSGNVSFAGNNYSDLSESEMTNFRGKNIGIVFHPAYACGRVGASMRTHVAKRA